MSTPNLAELLKLPVAKCIQLAQELCDSIPPDLEALQLTQEQFQEMEQRLAEHLTDPASAIPAAEARALLRERFGA
jgi:putative addiction module component (TIGR02574 family)